MSKPPKGLKAGSGFKSCQEVSAEKYITRIAATGIVDQNVRLHCLSLPRGFNHRFQVRDDALEETSESDFRLHVSCSKQSVCLWFRGPKNQSLATKFLSSKKTKLETFVCVQSIASRKSCPRNVRPDA